ncbi:hypothetical protein BH10PLA1_BH10PLA1_18880 [soil metagenome]
MDYRVLSPDQIEQFIEHGYVVLRQAIAKNVASQWVDAGFKRLGYDRHDRSTWQRARIHMPNTQLVDVEEFAPTVWSAVCDLLGGERRVQRPYKWSDGFIMNLGVGADRPWAPPSPASEGWHKDGDFFRHFLDSPEQGLLTIVCWTDMIHEGGGTFIAPDSVGVVARYLVEHPEGASPNDFGKLIHQCKQFAELTGDAGDVVLHHPYMLHATSQNVLRVERAITNPPVTLKEPMNFNRDNAADFSPLERGVLRGLGVDRYDFKPAAPREKIIPGRVKTQEKLLAEEKARLAVQ